MSYTLPDLPYNFTALEPHIDARTMEIHHGKHHAGYIAKLNAALEGTGLEGKLVEELISSLCDVPEEIRWAVRNNGGGHANHSLFWSVLTPEQTEPSKELTVAINDSFGSFEDMKNEFTAAATTRFGSGWAWIVVSNNVLRVVSTPNQDNPLMGKDTAGCSGVPILGLDVWEHAYYLNYQNRRPDYIEAFWNVVDWSEVSKRYADAKLSS